ncbi:hypothetical protein PR048_022925 [Dryococelus australis]|uniref:Uncharacterized protein n=1 Tax=Dryococelus australis TaxID=614101 RepID=A0ABQ9GSL7_9NEOP|nr:hypothetical protein PR048_022925 [Dryococelus australis]
MSLVYSGPSSLTYCQLNPRNTSGSNDHTHAYAVHRGRGQRWLPGTNDGEDAATATSAIEEVNRLLASDWPGQLAGTLPRQEGKHSDPSRVLRVACPQSHLSSKSSVIKGTVLKVTGPQSPVLKAICSQSPVSKSHVLKAICSQSSVLTVICSQSHVLKVIFSLSPVLKSHVHSPSQSSLISTCDFEAFNVVYYGFPLTQYQHYDTDSQVANMLYRVQFSQGRTTHAIFGRGAGKWRQVRSAKLTEAQRTETSCLLRVLQSRVNANIDVHVMTRMIVDQVKCRFAHVLASHELNDLNQLQLYVDLCFTAFGVGPLVFVRGSMNTEAYCNILDNEMLLTLWSIYGMDPCYFQDDSFQVPCFKGYYAVVRRQQCSPIGLARPEPRPQPYRTSLDELDRRRGQNPLLNSWNGCKRNGDESRGCLHARQGGCCYSRKKWPYEILTAWKPPSKHCGQVPNLLFPSNRHAREFAYSMNRAAVSIDDGGELISRYIGARAIQKRRRRCSTNANETPAPRPPREPGSIPGRVTGPSQVGIVPDDAAGRRVFSGNSRFPRPFIPEPLRIHFNHPQRFSKNSPLIAAQISSLTQAGLSKGGPSPSVSGREIPRRSGNASIARHEASRVFLRKLGGSLTTKTYALDLVDTPFPRPFPLPLQGLVYMQQEDILLPLPPYLQSNHQETQQGKNVRCQQTGQTYELLYPQVLGEH